MGLILFGSGMAALVYQMAWTRELRLVFGASTAATAAVLAVFIGGLGAGGLLFGARADRSARPLALYAGLELGAAAFAALSPFLLWIARLAYVGLGGSARLGSFGGSLLRLLLGALVLAPPTLLMGGAMPAAVAAVEADEDRGRRRLAVLYGLNTLGAVMGCVLATFVLLEALGTRRTLWSAAVLGGCVACIALFCSRKRRHLADETEAAGSGIAAVDAPLDRDSHEDRGPGTQAAAPTGFVLAVAGLVGFAFFLMELVWYRMLGPLLGGTVFAFGIILAVALLGIGAGSAAYGAAARRAHQPPSLIGLAVVCLVEATAIALPFAIGDGVALLALFLRPLGSAYGLAGHVGVWTLLAGLVVLPAAVASGIQFPLLIGLLGRGRAAVGRHTGAAYAANTAGAIVGSLAGGFGLLPALTAPGCWRLVSGLLVITALLSLALGKRRAPGGHVATVGLLAGSALVAVLLQSPGPTAVWRHSPIAVGRVDPSNVSSPSARHDWENSVRRSIARDDEGLESSVALDRSTGYAFILNGKTDGHARMDAGTQVMGGLFGAFLHPRPRSAFVIGLGTGSTSGWLAAVPSIERVDTVELEPAIAGVARDCAQVNHDVMANPKHHLLIGDAREVLLTSQVSYDIIASEPSNPYRAGIASLFTREYYQSAEHRLAKDGVFLQWVQAYAIDARTFRTILATLAGVFPQVEIWLMSPFDLLLVATREPIRYDAAVLRERMKEEPFQSGFASAWSTVSLEGVLAHHVARSPLARAIAAMDGAAINTDDRTLVEFGFARALTAQGAMHAVDVRALAQSRGLDRIQMVHDDTDGDAIIEEREAYGMSLGIPAVVPPGVSDKQRQRLTALNLWTAADYRSVLAHWRAQPNPPHGPVEAMVVADALADAGDESSLVLAGHLRGIWPSVAEGVAGRLYVRQGKPAEACKALEASLVAYRSQPWPPPTFMLRVLGLARDLAYQDPAWAGRLFDLLAVPFAVRMMDETRAQTRISLAHLAPPGPACVEALAYFEPNVPWQGDFLSFRAACYSHLGLGLAAKAFQDLQAFRAQAPADLAAQF